MIFVLDGNLELHKNGTWTEWARMALRADRSEWVYKTLEEAIAVIPEFVEAVETACHEEDNHSYAGFTLRTVNVEGMQEGFRNTYLYEFNNETQKGVHTGYIPQAEPVEENPLIFFECDQE